MGQGRGLPGQRGVVVVVVVGVVGVGGWNNRTVQQDNTA